jgi:two-component system, sensor histidine kinase and response regulator
MTELACASESNFPAVKRLLRIGFGLAVAFEIIMWIELARETPALSRIEGPFLAADILLATAALWITRYNWLRTNWRILVMCFCLTLVATRTLSAVVIDRDESLLLVMVVLLLGTGVLVPWSARWQGLLMMASMLAFAIASATGAPEPRDLDRWLVLAAIGMSSLSFVALKRRYRDQDKLISELTDKERNLARSQKILRTLFDAVPDIVALTKFSDGKVLEANDECLRRIGLTREQALATSVVELGAWVHPEERAAYVRQLTTEKRVRNLAVDFHLQGVIVPYLMSSVIVEIEGELYALNVARDATHIRENERALYETQQRLREQVDRLTEAQARMRDQIAERREAEARLTKSEAILRRTLDSIPDIVLTRQGDVVNHVNHEYLRRTGLTRAEVVGKPVEQMTLFVRREDRAEFLRRIEADGVVQNFQADLLLKGKRVPCLVSGVSIKTEEGPLIFSISRDISSRIQMERELVDAREAALAASQAKSEFLSSMSHEIRTPMNAILGMAELLSEGPLNDEQRRYLDTMSSNGQVLLRLLDDILDLAKIESGRMNLESVPFNLEDLVDHAVETTAARAHGKGLELTARILPDVPENLIGDPLRLRQILINLLSNGIKFTQKGEVSLAIDVLTPDEAIALNLPHAAAQNADRHPGRPVAWVRFSITDTGIGIPADKLATIFSSFTQADASISRRFGGSGLGLSIVRRLTEIMGGRVEVESEADRGSTFRVTLAMRIDTRPSLAARHTPAGILNGISILVVDDNRNNRLVLQEMLANAGVRVGEADSGAAAIAELRRAMSAGDAYRLVLLDSGMPEMNGEKIARLIIEQNLACARGMGPHPIIMMLTTDNLNSTLDRMRQASVDCYVIKPVKRAELLDKIRGMLSAPESRPAPQHNALVLAPSESTPPLRILLAEDAPDNRLLVQAYLKNLPYHVEVAENGRIAIEMFKSLHPDLVLMDVQMPEMDGLAAARAIRTYEAESGLARTPIIALTASALEDDVRRSLDSGCDQHVSKPINKAVLLAAIRKAAASRCAGDAGLSELRTATGQSSALDEFGSPSRKTA